MGINSTLNEKLSKSRARINQLIVRNPRTYISFLCLLAFTGYAFVLLFPMLVITSISSIFTILFENDVIDGLHFLIWFAILLISGLISYRMIATRPVPAVGFTMPESKIPKVYEVVQRMQTHFKRPKIDRIIISADYELNIVKTPKWMLPVWSSNTLVIGLPMLICLTPHQFEHMVARRMGQFSKQHNMITNWLYQLNNIWKQYSYIYGKQKSLESSLLKMFFMTFSAVYERLSVAAARMDEFNADDYAMQIYFHEDICEMITTDALCRWYLEKRFWPAIDKAYNEDTKDSHQPYRKLTAVIRENLNKVNKPMLNNLLMDETIEYKNRYPSLRQRLDKIGYTEPLMKRYSGESAADFYLGASLNGALNLMDKLWCKNNKKISDSKVSRKKWIPIFNNN